MNRRETASFTATTDQTDLAYGESACLETPPELFAALDQEFGFSIDLAANTHNHLLSRWFGPGSCTDTLDARTVNWSYWDSKGFCNPAYGQFATDMVKCAVAQQGKGFLSVFLLPMRANRAFKSLILPHADEIRFVDERIKFWYHGQPKPNPKTGKADGALFDSIIVVFRPRKPGILNYGPRVSVWHWDKARREKLEAARG